MKWLEVHSNQLIKAHPSRRIESSCFLFNFLVFPLESVAISSSSLTIVGNLNKSFFSSFENMEEKKSLI